MHIRSVGDFPGEWNELALTGGEDYELLFTAASGVVDRLKATLDVPVSVVGEIVDGPPNVRVVDRVGNDVPLPRTGWDHFR